jgi:hypothetical protein
MRNYVCYVCLMSTLLLVSSSVWAETVTCKRVNCTPVQPNGGEMAKDLCNTFIGPFVLETTSSKNGSFVSTLKGGSSASDKVRYFVDTDKNYNLGSDNHSGEILGFLSLQNNKTGKLIINES